MVWFFSLFLQLIFDILINNIKQWMIKVSQIALLMTCHSHSFTSRALRSLSFKRAKILTKVRWIRFFFLQWIFTKIKNIAYDYGVTWLSNKEFTPCSRFIESYGSYFGTLHNFSWKALVGSLLMNISSVIVDLIVPWMSYVTVSATQGFSLIG